MTLKLGSDDNVYSRYQKELMLGKSEITINDNKRKNDVYSYPHEQ